MVEDEDVNHNDHSDAANVILFHLVQWFCLFDSIFPPISVSSLYRR